MTDDRENDDAAGWFAAQFGSHDDADKGTDAVESDEAADAGESSNAPDASEPDDGATGEPAAPLPATPASGGSFNWGLTPTGTAAPTPPVSPIPSTPEPPADPPALPEPVQPPEPTAPPTPVGPAVSSFAPPLAVPPGVPPVVPAAVVTSVPVGIPPAVPSVLPTADSFFPPVASPATPVFAPPPLVVPPVTPPVVLSGEPQPFDAALAGGPSPEAEPPTVALPWEGSAAELFAPPVAGASVAEPATELLGGFGPGAAGAAAGSSAESSPAEGSSVDALFGESQFREYQPGPLGIAPAGKPAPSKAPRQPSEPKHHPRAPLPHSQKVLFWIAGSLAALLVLVGLFFLGTKLPRSSGAPVAAVTPTASVKPTPNPTPTALPVGPLAAGSYKWDQLLGGECLDPFTSPWVEKFTVVDCGAPHPAQMVARGVFAEAPPAVGNESTPATPSVGEPASDYPGADALQAQINLLCTAPSVIDFAAAGAYSDIQILGSYPATAKQWTDGDRSYFCFVTRSSGEPITGSLAVPPAAPAA